MEILRMQKLCQSQNKLRINYKFL